MSTCPFEADEGGFGVVVEEAAAIMAARSCLVGFVERTSMTTAGEATDCEVLEPDDERWVWPRGLIERVGVSKSCSPKRGRLVGR